MMRAIDRKGKRGPLVLALLVASLWLKLLVPAGYMLAPTAAAGSPLLVPCEGVAVPAAPMMHAGMHGKQKDHHPAGKSHASPCPYAALSAPAAPPQPPLVLNLLVPAETILPFAAAAPSTVRALGAPPPPSTGPPHLL